MSRYGEDAKLVLTRSKHAVTFFGHPNTFPPVQVILSAYASPVSLLTDFDVDCCCCAYVPNEKRVVCTPRCLRALRYGVNVADSDFDGPCYHLRLSKYDHRGFAIAVPGFDDKYLTRSIVDGHYLLLEPYDLFVKATPENIEDLKLTVHENGETIERCTKPSTTHKCTIVRGFERLVAQKYAKRMQIVAASCRVRQVFGADGFRLVYGLEDEEADDETYSMSPLASVHILFKHVFERRIQCSSETPEFEWWTGGAMKKFASEPLKESIRASQGEVRANAELQFVYEVCDCRTPFADLRYILDAGRAPLCDLGEDAFRRTYGLDRTLSFQHGSRRARVKSDWWGAVYA